MTFEPFHRYVMLVDGMCGLCAKNEPFTRAHDSKKQIYVDTLQSAFGQETLQQLGLPTSNFESFVWVEKGRAYLKSDASLRYLRALDGAWPLLYAFILIPRPLRDWVYERVSANRYKWFGRRDDCLVLH